MAYNIYMLVTVADKEVSCALRCASYAKEGHGKILAYEVLPDGTEKKYDWHDAYLKISSEAAVAAHTALKA